MAVTAFVAAIAVAAGAGTRSIGIGAAILVGQASIGWANDAVDAARDTLVARLDKPVAAGEVTAGTVSAFAGAALVATIPLSLAIGWRPGAAHLVAVGSAWLYDLRWKETVASWAPYALSFGLLPVIVATALPGSPLPQPLVVAAAAVLGVAAHFANTVGDVDADARTGVRGLPQRLGPRRSLMAAAVGLAGAAWLLAVATRFAVLPVVAAVLAPLSLAVLGRRDVATRAAFAVLIATVAMLVAGFVVAGGDHLTAR